MTKREQKHIVRTLCESIQSSVLQAIEQRRIPDSWDGIELRQYVAELAMNSRATWFQSLKDPRRKEYENTTLVNNL